MKETPPSPLPPLENTEWTLNELFSASDYLNGTKYQPRASLMKRSVSLLNSNSSIDDRDLSFRMEFNTKMLSKTVPKIQALVRGMIVRSQQRKKKMYYFAKEHFIDKLMSMEQDYNNNLTNCTEVSLFETF